MTDTINCFPVNKIPGKMISCVHTCGTGRGRSKNSILQFSDADSPSRDSFPRLQLCQAQPGLHWWGCNNATRRLPTARRLKWNAECEGGKRSESEFVDILHTKVGSEGHHEENPESLSKIEFVDTDGNSLSFHCPVAHSPCKVVDIC